MIYLDACPNGWGVAHENMSSGGHWSVEERKLHINVLELLASDALQIYCKNMFNISVHLKVHNINLDYQTNRNPCGYRVQISL